MSIIKNYDSSLSLDNYKIRDTYMFYINNSNIKNLPKINKSDFDPYIKSLTDIIEKNVVDNNTQHFNFTKSIGIVVDKHEANDERDIDKITVMFRTDDDRYVLNKYVVNSNDIFTNNKDFISPSAVLRTA